MPSQRFIEIEYENAWSVQRKSESVAFRLDPDAHDPYYVAAQVRQRLAASTAKEVSDHGLGGFVPDQVGLPLAGYFDKAARARGAPSGVEKTCHVLTDVRVVPRGEEPRAIDAEDRSISELASAWEYVAWRPFDPAVEHDRLEDARMLVAREPGIAEPSDAEHDAADGQTLIELAREAIPALAAEADISWDSQRAGYLRDLINRAVHLAKRHTSEPADVVNGYDPGDLEAMRVSLPPQDLPSQQDFDQPPPNLLGQRIAVAVWATRHYTYNDLSADMPREQWSALRDGVAVAEEAKISGNLDAAVEDWAVNRGADLAYSSSELNAALDESRAMAAKVEDAPETDADDGMTAS